MKFASSSSKLGDLDVRKLRVAGRTYVALQGALEDELLSHVDVLPGIRGSVEEW